MGLQFSITRVEATDARVVKVLFDAHAVCFDNATEPPAFWEETVWAAWVNGDRSKFAGFCSMKPGRTAGRMYLSRAGVLPSCRGHGLQRRFIYLRERAARSLGYTHMVSDTCDALHSSNNLIACGYKMYEPTETWALKDSIYWIKEL